MNKDVSELAKGKADAARSHMLGYVSVRVMMGASTRYDGINEISLIKREPSAYRGTSDGPTSLSQPFSCREEPSIGSVLNKEKCHYFDLFQPSLGTQIKIKKQRSFPGL